jgi:hypothetical protein
VPLVVKCASERVQLALKCAAETEVCRLCAAGFEERCRCPAAPVSPVVSRLHSEVEGSAKPRAAIIAGPACTLTAAWARGQISGPASEIPSSVHEQRRRRSWVDRICEFESKGASKQFGRDISLAVAVWALELRSPVPEPEPRGHAARALVTPGRRVVVIILT